MIRDLEKRLQSRSAFNYTETGQPERRVSPSKIVIHAAAEFIDQPNRDYPISDWFQKVGVNAHTHIHGTGTVEHKVPVSQIAWHARGHNVDSVGIELIVPGVHTWSTFIEALKTEWWTPKQIESCIWQVAKLMHDHPSIKKVVGHHEISDKKPDPGERFPLRRVEHMARDLADLDD